MDYPRPAAARDVVIARSNTLRAAAAKTGSKALAKIAASVAIDATCISRSAAVPAGASASSASRTPGAAELSAPV